MKKETDIFQSGIFIFNLVLLLCNDFYWKQTYHNALTGKISDFAGLVVFALFFTAFFPVFKKNIFIGTAILFTFWKSAFSESFIQFLNDSYFPCSRVVDYSDLMALLVLPFIYDYKRFTINILLPQYLRLAIASIALFAIYATSPPPSSYYKIQDKSKNIYTLHHTFVLDRKRVAIIEHLKKQGEVEDKEYYCVLKNFIVDKDTFKSLTFTIAKSYEYPTFNAIRFVNIQFSHPLQQKKPVKQLTTIEERIKNSIFSVPMF
jgi:hypothetical protein